MNDTRTDLERRQDMLRELMLEQQRRDALHQRAEQRDQAFVE